MLAAECNMEYLYVRAQSCFITVVLRRPPAERSLVCRSTNIRLGMSNALIIRAMNENQENTR